METQGETGHAWRVVNTQERKMRKQAEVVAVTDYESVTLTDAEQKIHEELKQIWALEKDTKARLVASITARHRISDEHQLQVTFRYGPAMRLIEKPQVAQSTKRTLADFLAAQSSNGHAI